MKKIPLLFSLLAVPFVGSDSWAKTLLPVEAHLVAERYGFSQAENIEQLTFTFNVEKGTTVIHRQWHWDRQNNITQVTTTLADQTNFTYRLDRSTNNKSWSENDFRVDQWFINDTYWVLFPFHLIWDDSMTVTTDKNVLSPYSKRPFDRLTVKYSSTEKSGYTPGDIYELYVGVDGIVDSWSYRKAGAATPAWTVSWDNATQVGPFTFSTFHTDQHKTFKIIITNLAVKLKDRAGWIYPDQKH